MKNIGMAAPIIIRSETPCKAALAGRLHDDRSQILQPPFEQRRKRHAG